MPIADIEEGKLRSRIKELARRHGRWGRRLVYHRLRLDGWNVNHKRVQRIWREEGLQRTLPRKRKRSHPPGGSRELLRAEYLHYAWAIDFQFDQTTPSAWKDDASLARPRPTTRGLDGAEQCVVTARWSKLM